MYGIISDNGATQAKATNKSMWGSSENATTAPLGLQLKSVDILMSDEIYSIFTTIVDEWMCLFIAAIGVINNIICIAVFTKQGFKDTVNITMTTIAFWDVVKLLCGLIVRIYGPISLVNPAMGKSWKNIAVTNIVYFQGIAGNISYIMAGYVSIERSLCVCLPFDVKRILTPKITIGISSSISVSIIGSLAPVLFIFEVMWVYSETYCTDVAVYKYSSFYDLHGHAFMEYYKLMAFFYPMFSLFTMIISTAIITFQLRRASKFRLKGISPFQGHDQGRVKDQSQWKLTYRDRQVVKLLLVVILAYICNLLPRFVHFMVSLIVSEYYVLKLYNNIFWCVVYSIYVLDYLNASALLFIYFSMSSNFRAMFRSMIPLACFNKSR